MQNFLVHILIALLLLAVLVFLNVTGSLDPVIDSGRGVAGVLSRPFTAAFVPVKNFFSVASSIKGLAEENIILTAQVAKLSADLATLEKVDQENRRLSEALGFLPESDIQLVPARVITFDPLRQNQKAILNRGRAEGVRPGEAVVVAENILVGIVAEVFEHTSEMEVITSSAITISAQTSNGEAKGVVRGEHGLGLLFDLVSQNEVVAVGDRVITSGLGGQLPKNLYVGDISEVRSGSSELFQSASIIPAANLRDLGVVFIFR